MAYGHDMGREMRRLIPLAASSVAITVLVTAKIVRMGEVGSDDVGLLFVSYWFLVMLYQAASTLSFMLIAAIMHYYAFPVRARLPVLISLSAIGGAAVLWWAGPWIGAVCGLVTLTGWLLSIRDRLLGPDHTEEKHG